jgi:hypothetical protein
MGRTEKMNHVEAVAQLHYIFHADRPVVEKNNLDVSSIIRLLHQEIFELNGHPEDGMSLEDYRAQEISDIQYFVYSLMKAVGSQPSQASIDGFLAENSLVWPEQSRVMPDYNYEDEYTRLKYILRDTADSLYLDESHTATIPAEQIMPIAQKILDIAVALHVVLQRNPTEEMRDKGARNLLKHSIKGYDNPDNEYATVARQKGKDWKAEAERGGGNPGFFSRTQGIYNPDVDGKIEYANLKPLTVESAKAEVEQLTGKKYEEIMAVPAEWSSAPASAQAVIEFLLASQRTETTDELR